MHVSHTQKVKKEAVLVSTSNAKRQFRGEWLVDEVGFRR